MKAFRWTKHPVTKSLRKTLNKQGLLKFEATKVGRETALAQIIKLVEQAQGSKARSNTSSIKHQLS